MPRLVEYPLNKLSLRHASNQTDPTTGAQVLHVTRPHALIQAAGYLKHVRAAQFDKRVYFRGQRKLYPSLPPSAYRDARTPQMRSERAKQIDAVLNRIRDGDEALRAVDERAREPILQHYGMNTRWLDVVDNVWVALWFACHTAHSHGRYNEYLHYERRVERREAMGERFAYILLLEVAGATWAGVGPGWYRDDDSVALDLRIAAPSQFVRPHAQHGLVAQALSHAGKVAADFSSLVVGIIRIDLADALDWLGIGHMLSVHALFPPSFYDVGYKELLAGVTTGGEIIGSIAQVGAGT